MLAVGATAVVVIALTVFAMQTKWDFTMMGGVLFVGLWLMIMFSFILMFMRSHVAELIFSCFGALLFSAYLIRKCLNAVFSENYDLVAPFFKRKFSSRQMTLK